MVIVETIPFGGLQGSLVRPRKRSSLGILLLHGSSGIPDISRAGLLAEQGACVVALRWFGGEAQSPGICEIPLETFFKAFDCLLHLGCRRIAVVGTSKGAEAALLVACHDKRIDVVVAISPSSVVWGNIGAGPDGRQWPERSSWSLKSQPLPFVPACRNWQATFRDGLISYRSLFTESLLQSASCAAAAAIPLERSEADILLVAGSDDALWPSDYFAHALVARRASAGKPTRLLLHPKAGHRILFPGETRARSTRHAHGGTDEADQALGTFAWNEMFHMMGFGNRI